MATTEDVVMRDVEPAGPMLEVDPHATLGTLGLPGSLRDDAEVAGFACGEHTVELPNWMYSTDRTFSEEFELAGYSWKVMVEPKDFTKHRTLAVYLQSQEAKYLPMSITPKVKFSLILVNMKEPNGSIYNSADHHFTKQEDDWGFAELIHLHDLFRKADEFLVNDVLRIRVRVEVLLDDKFTGATRKETGYVGLKNQGATCYMNSLLQTLYNIPAFREAVYHIPMEEQQEPSSSIAVALKYLFFNLQHSSTPVSTKDLISSFGWKNMEAFQQHDVEELELKLFEKLEEKMKGTIVDKTIDQLLKGKLYNYIECINVDYKSTRTEEFINIQLDVMGCKGLTDSFDKICKVEIMDGDNRYHAEGHGLQDAKRGVLMEQLPPVLQLTLKRYDYDRVHWTPVKVNTRYEFSETLDLNADNNKYLAPSADLSVTQKYRLFSVLVHSGATHTGHYYAYIRPDLESWYKFDDECVTKAEESEAIEQQFGEDPGMSNGIHRGKALPKMRVSSNAYLLVYVRESDWEHVMRESGKDLLDAVTKRTLQARLEDKAAKRREKMHAHRFVTFRMAAIEHAQAHVQREKFHLVDMKHIPEDHTLKVDKTQTWGHVMHQVKKLVGMEPEEQAYWLFVRRSNNTDRPETEFIPIEQASEPIKYQHREWIRNRHRILTTTKDPVEVFVTRRVTLPKPPEPAPQTSTWGGWGSVQPRHTHPQLIFLKTFQAAPTPRLWLMQPVIAYPVTTIAHILRSVYKPPEGGDIHQLFNVWEEVRVEPELSMKPISDLTKPLADLMESINGDIFVVQPLEDWPGMPPPPPLSQLDAATAGDSDLLHAEPPAAEAATRGAAEAPPQGSLESAGAAEMQEDRGGGADAPPEFASAVDYLSYLWSLRQLHMKPLPGATLPEGEGEGPLPELVIRVERNAEYARVVSKLGQKLKRDPRHLRLTLMNSITKLPHRKPLPHGTAIVSDPYHSPTQLVDVFYEVLDMPLEELEQLKTLRVKRVKANGELIMFHDVRLAPDCTVTDLLDQIRKQTNRPDERFRICKVYQSKVFDLPAADDPVKDLDTSYWTVRVEALPEDDIATEAACAETDAKVVAISVSHTTPNTAARDDFGEPLVAWLAPTETLASLQKRIQDRLKVDAEEFNSWQWAFRQAGGECTQLTDPQTVVSTLLEEANAHATYKAQPASLCLVHEKKGYGGQNVPPHRMYYAQHEAKMTLS